MNGLKALTVLCFCLLVACEGGDGSTVTPPVANAKPRLFPSDADILSRAYDPLYRVPDDFLVDERAGTTQGFSVHHVKNESGLYELCTNDFSQALAWETSDNESASVQGPFTGAIETEKYFEFIRELSNSNGIGNITNSTSPGFARVFKCTYVNRDGIDRHIRNGDAGTLNIEQLSEEAIRDFSEYMWQFTFFWPAAKTVLETFSSESASDYQHTLLLAFLTQRSTEQCDLIEVVDWVFSVDKKDGRVRKEFMPVYELEAQLDVSGKPKLCGP